MPNMTKLLILIFFLIDSAFSFKNFPYYSQKKQIVALEIWSKFETSRTTVTKPTLNANSSGSAFNGKSSTSQSNIPSSSFFSNLEKNIFGLGTAVGAKMESDLRNVGITASLVTKRVSKDVGKIAIGIDETIAKPIMNVPSTIKTISDPDSWNLLQSGINPLKTPKMIGSFDATSTKQRVQLKKKAPQFEKKPNPVAPDTLFRSIRTLPATLKYDYDLRVRTREKEEAAALNRQLSDGSAEPETSENLMSRLSDGREETVFQSDNLAAYAKEETQVREITSVKSVDQLMSADIVPEMDFLSSGTAINPSAYIDDDNDEGAASTAERTMKVTTSNDINISNDNAASVTGNKQVRLSVENDMGAKVQDIRPPQDVPPPLVVETTAVERSSLDEKTIKKFGLAAIDVIFFLAETAVKAAAPIVKDGGAVAAARLQDAFFPDDGGISLLKTQSDNKAKTSSSTALSKIEQELERKGEWKVLGSLQKQKMRK